ncbi:MAG: hypothetical protein J6D37_05740 [Clostridia bacterium]|nr:hypothetical protein [Clostridia bacterium]
MNVIFCVLFILASILMLVKSPESYLSALLAGGEKAGSLCIFLLASYAVWMAFFALVTDTGLDRKFAKLCHPILKLLFRTRDEETLSFLSSNLSCNLLGLAAATPLGIKATNLLFRQGQKRDLAMLFVVNATSLQILPTTVFSLRSAAGSLAPTDIFLPTLLSTLFSTVLGVLLVKVIYR